MYRVNTLLKMFGFSVFLKNHVNIYTTNWFILFFRLKKTRGYLKNQTGIGFFQTMWIFKKIKFVIGLLKNQNWFINPNYANKNKS